MKFVRCILPFLVLFLMVSCNGNEKHQELEKRETELAAKEKSFADKEAEYQSLIKMRDSIFSKNDSVKINPLPVSITGKWNGKMVCTESNCPEYVVGDTRVDEWEITEENGGITATNLNKTGVVRVYKGKYDGSALRLSFASDPDAEKQLDFKIDFTTLENNKLFGSREVQVNKSCLSKFSIELTR